MIEDYDKSLTIAAPIAIGLTLAAALAVALAVRARATRFSLGGPFGLAAASDGHAVTLTLGPGVFLGTLIVAGVLALVISLGRYRRMRRG